MEKRIGTIAGWVGGIAFLVAVSYFFKLAIDNEWIGHTGQIAIGLLVGIGIVVGSEYLRGRGNKVFSYLLKGVGIGTLYFSFWAAFQIYHLIDVKVAFVAMVVVTGATIAMALAQDAVILAFFALVGGFFTPIMLSTGSNAEAVLFTYVAVLDIATLVIAMMRPWRGLLWVNFIATEIFYFGWADSYVKSSSSPRSLTLFFIVLFGAIFAAIPIATPFKKSKKLPGPAITILLLPLLNAIAVFLAFVTVYHSDMAKLTWFALGLAVVYLCMSAVFRQRFPQEDTKIIDLMHVAIAIAFITIAIPLKLDGHWITMGWLIESAVLLWIGVQMKNAFLRYLATSALVLGLVRLLFLDEYTIFTPVFNPRFATYLVAIAILGGIIYFGSRPGPEIGQGKRVFVYFAVIALNILALIATTREAYDYYHRQSQQLVEEYSAEHTSVEKYESQSRTLELRENFSYSAIWLAYGALLMMIGFSKKSGFIRWQALILMGFTVCKIFLYDTKELEGPLRVLSFVALAAVLLGVSFAYLKLAARSGQDSTGEPKREET